ncbi:MAG: DUF3570 domain-containing protein [Deltaproteobacteria bacterium]|nr:DUF3570 domain-containing protein [Deltaproteobacteria bacterium]
MQLTAVRGAGRRGRRLTLLALMIALAGSARTARAEDRAEVSTSLFAEKREGATGRLTVIHPQALFGVDLGRFVTLDAGYAADAVSGATASVYQVDAVSAATEFSDLRHEGTVALGFRGKRSRFTVSGTFGTERDYLSRQVGGSASIDLPGRNTTVALAYTHGFDQVCNRDNGDATPLEARALTGDDACTKSAVVAGKDRTMADTDGAPTRWEDLSIDTAAVTLTQNLSPTMNLQLALFGQIQEGFQSNPYRRVRIGPNAPQEHIPDTRARWSVSARLNRYLPLLKAAVHFDGRFYNDTWGVSAGNLELAYSQYAGKSLLVKVYARIYQQTAATFFKDAFYYATESTAGEYFTGDRELSPVRNGTVGGKLTVITIGEDKPVLGLFDKLQLNLKGDIMLIDLLAADSLADNPMGIDRQFIYGNSLIDAIVIQLGLLGNY